MDDEVEIEDEHRNKAYKYLVSQIPLGEAVEAFKDLENLLPDEGPEHAKWKSRVLLDYIGDKRAVVSIPGGGKTVLFPEARTEDGQYVDPLTNFVLEVEPAKIHVRGTVEGPERDLKCEPLQKALTAHIEKYQEEQYPRGAARALVKERSGKYTVVIVIAAHDSSLRNSWCGSWISNWYVDIDTALQVRGNITVRVFDCDEATGSFTHTKSMDSTMLPKSDSVDAVARVVAQFIQAEDHAVAQSIEKSLLLFGDELQPLRRSLPVTKELCEWASGERLKLAKEMRENIY